MPKDDPYELTPEEEELYVECSRLMLTQLHDHAMRLLGGGPFDGLDPFLA